MIKGIGPVKINNLLTSFKDVREIFKNKEQVKRILGEKITCRVFSKKSWKYLKEELYYIKKYDIEIVTILDRDYPLLLKQIYSPPIVLYIKGNKQIINNRCLGVVGSRRASSYGIKNARTLSYDLVQSGFTVVSGLARGIDTAAHKGCLQARGETIAVLGSGLLDIYPRENQILSAKIQQKGCIISEFSLKSRPARENFPRRNRIISGLSLGTLIVEAALPSGALITANFALEQGREVFALPGRIDSDVGKGVNYLIKQGAVLVENVQDILEELNMYLCKTGTQDNTGFLNAKETVKNPVN